MLPMRAPSDLWLDRDTALDQLDKRSISVQDCQHFALVRLLIAKGLFTEAEYHEAERLEFNSALAEVIDGDPSKLPQGDGFPQ